MKTMTPSELRRSGLEALTRALGPVGMVGFMQQFESGSRDYSADRSNWLHAGDVTSLAERIRARRSLNIDESSPSRESGSVLESGILESGIPAISERREKRKCWVQRGQYAIEVEVEVIYPGDDPTEPCLDPATVRWLDEIARRAEAGDVEYLRTVGRVFQAVAS